MPDTDLSPLAKALGRVPCGLYIVTTQAQGTPIGFLGSFVMQVGFEPPMVCVAVGKGRAHLEAIRSSGRFALSQIDKESSKLMTPFMKKPPENTSPFDGLSVERTPGGSTVLSDALAWIECEVSGEHEVGDHVVVFGRAVAGGLQRAGDPRIHLRKDGFGY